MDKRELIDAKEAILGIEMGSTRIKAVLIDGTGAVLATGIHDWENSFVNGIWTYSFEEIIDGLQSCYASLRENIRAKYGTELRGFRSMGISAMMHGYIALDREDRPMSAFQTWRNTNTQEAADVLTELFQYNIPQRWSVAHTWQRILDGEAYCREICKISTLSSYIHCKLTGRHVIGIGDASGMFPIDSEMGDYDQAMVDRFDSLLAERQYPWKLREVFPKVLKAGEHAGALTEAGARLLDRSGCLQPGIPLCPPEGDAGTGMVATNSVAPRTGNVSAGTSTFAMIVLEKKLSALHREIDMVTTPDGYPVAMSHANNGTSDLNAWVKLFGEFAELSGHPMGTQELFEKLYTVSTEGAPDAGGLLAYGYYSGENITEINEGRLAFLRTPTSDFSLKNFMKVHLYTSLGAVKIGMDILQKEEHIRIDRIMGHGGFFKTPGVGQRYLAAAVNAPVTVMDTASEGGAWGIALLAAYLVRERTVQTLPEYLEKEIFGRMSGQEMLPLPEEVEGFEQFMERYRAGLEVERAAVRSMDW